MLYVAIRISNSTISPGGMDTYCDLAPLLMSTDSEQKPVFTFSCVPHAALLSTEGLLGGVWLSSMAMVVATERDVIVR